MTDVQKMREEEDDVVVHEDDRFIVNKAVNRQKLWTVEATDRTGVRLVTDFNERLSIAYGNSGQVKFATYTHWDLATGEVVSREDVTRNKRKRVLELIG